MQSELLLIAAVSRLIDLHDSQRPPGQNTRKSRQSKRSYEHSAYYLSLGFIILKAVHRLERENGRGTFYSTAHIATTIVDLDKEYDLKDISYCLHLLSTPREIHFTSDETDTKGSTADLTQLLKRSASEYDQYCLTESARLLFRISSVTKDWFYEGEEANKLVRAIKNGFFEHVPQFCNERIESLLNFCRMITSLKERAAFDDTAQEFFDNRSVYEKTLSDARDAVGQAVSLLTSDEVFDSKWEEWKQQNSDSDLRPEHLLSYLAKVAKMIEFAGRMLVDFITNIHKYKAAGMGVVQFHEIASEIVQRDLNIGILEEFHNHILPAPLRQPFFHPFDWKDVIDLDERTEPDESYRVDLTNNGEETIGDRFNSFIERNRQWLIETLAKRGGAIPFSELLATGKFALMEGESPAMLYGFCANPEGLDISERISVTLTGAQFRKDIEYETIYGDELEITLERKLGGVK